MKMVSFTDFRKNASSFITEVEHGETIVLLRQGKPVAEVIPYSDKPKTLPAWKKPGIHLQISGSDLSAAVLEEREEFVDENYDLLQRECTFEELYRNAKLGWVGYKSSCGAAAEAAISSDGRLYPCRMLMYDELSAGSVVENELEDLWQNSATFRRIREFDYQKIKECSECELFGLCIGGCRAVAYARTGRIDGWIGPDFCHEQKQRFRHKLVIGVRAKKERERKHAQTVDQ